MPPSRCQSQITRSLFRHPTLKLTKTFSFRQRALAWFSSRRGTTGLPKGAILPKTCFTGVDLAEPGEVSVNYRPGHWIGGARTLIMSTIAGREIHSLGEKGSAENVLNAFRSHRITRCAFNPTLLRRMKELLVNEDGIVPEDKRSEYAGWFQGLARLTCSAGMVEPSTQKFWTDLTGLPMYIVYSATELGGPTIATRDPTYVCGAILLDLASVLVFSELTVVAQGLIGTPMPDVKVKLSQQYHGEILVKSPKMLTG